MLTIIFAGWSAGASCLAFALLILSGMAMAPSRLDPIYPRESKLPLLLVPVAITQLMLVVLFIVALIIRSGGLFYCLFVWLVLLSAGTFCCVIACAAGALEENERLTNETVFHSMQLYETDPSIGDFWDNFQRTELCCGYFGAGDWLYSVHNKKYPKACCSHNGVSLKFSSRSKTCAEQFGTRVFVFKLGCAESIDEERGFEIRYITFIIIGIIVVLYNIIGIVFSYRIGKKGFDEKDYIYGDHY